MHAPFVHAAESNGTCPMWRTSSSRQFGSTAHTSAAQPGGLTLSMSPLMINTGAAADTGSKKPAGDGVAGHSRQAWICCRAR